MDIRDDKRDREGVRQHGFEITVRIAGTVEAVERSWIHENKLAWWLSWLERRPVTAEVVGSNPIRVVTS